MILEIINEQASKINCHRVKKIYLEVGELLAVDKSALLFGFEVVAAGTIAEQASLTFIDVPGLANCAVCQKVIRLNRYYQSCDGCQQFALTIIQGETLQVQSMEVE